MTRSLVYLDFGPWSERWTQHENLPARRSDEKCPVSPVPIPGGCLACICLPGPSLSFEDYLLVHRRDNFLSSSSSPVKAPPTEHNDQHDDQNDYLGTHGASLPTEVGGEHINICHIFESVEVTARPAKYSNCKWPANNRKIIRNSESSFNNRGLDQ